MSEFLYPLGNGWEGWENCTAPEKMLRRFRSRGRGQQLRLFACACLRRARAFLEEEPVQQALEAAERHALGEVGDEEYGAASAAALAVAAGAGSAGLALYALQTILRVPADSCQPCPPVVEAARLAALAVSAGNASQLEAERAAQAQLVRCVFGNPFRPPVLRSAWLTPEVLAVARHARATSDFGLLPALADALEWAGCRNPTLLGHCRAGAAHARGCHVLTAVLGTA